VLPGRVIDVRYEELVARPEAVLRGVLQQLGLHWDAQVLVFQAAPRAVQTHSMQQVLPRPISAPVYWLHLGPYLVHYVRADPLRAACAPATRGL
jgi:hypothetical protein